jgi:hypothetical protein
LQRGSPAQLRRPKHFDLAAWEELAPNLADVMAELRKTAFD